MKTIVDDFIKVVRLNGNKTALISEEATLSYSELFIHVSKIQSFLRKKGVKRGDMLPIIMTPSNELVATILALFSLGAGYVPVAANSPTIRMRDILAQVDSDLVLTNLDNLLIGAKNHFEVINSKVIKHMDINAELINQGGIADNAYMIFTSGSTGVPKGVFANHQNLNYILDNMQQIAPVLRDDAYLLGTPIGFDVSITELLGWIRGAGKLVISDLETKKNFFSFARIIQQHRITHVAVSPSVMKVLTNEDLMKLNNSVKYLMVAGEEFPWEMSQRLCKYMPSARIFNLYGPTEATIYAAGYELSGRETHKVPIGQALKGAQITLSDVKKTEIDGYGLVEVGEIIIQGLGVTQGYWNDSEKTATSFMYEKTVASYKTGDLGFFDTNDNLIYLGRVDQQIQIHGIRVEPEEIRNAALQTHIRLQAFEVIYHNNRLLGFYVKNTGVNINSDVIKNKLSKILPSYMVPSIIVEVPYIPISINGKVDKTKLLEYVMHTDENITCQYTADNEYKIAKIISRTMELEYVVSPDYNIFDNGADSLNCVEITIALSDLIGREVDPLFVTLNPTVQSMYESLFAGKAKKERCISEKGDLVVTKNLIKQLFLPSFNTYQKRLGNKGYSEGEVSTFQKIYKAIELNSFVDFETDVSVVKTTINEILDNLFANNTQLRTKFVLRDKEYHAWKYNFDKNPVTILDIRKLNIDIVYFIGTLLSEAKKLIQAYDTAFPSYMVALQTGDHEFKIIGTLHHLLADGATRNVLKKQVLQYREGRKVEGTDFDDYQRTLKSGSRLELMTNPFTQALNYLNKKPAEGFISEFPDIEIITSSLSQEQKMYIAIEHITKKWMEVSDSEYVSAMSIFSFRRLQNKNFENIIGDCHSNVLFTRWKFQNRLTFINHLKHQVELQKTAAFSTNEYVYGGFPDISEDRQLIVKDYEAVSLNINYIGEVSDKEFDELIHNDQQLEGLKNLNKQFRLLSFSNGVRLGTIIAGY